MSPRTAEASLLLRHENAVPIRRRGLDLELRDAPPVEIVNGGEEAGRGEPAVVEQAQCRCPILPAVGSQQGGMLVGELLFCDVLWWQRIDTAGLGLAFHG